MRTQPSASAVQAPRVERLAWMAGCWLRRGTSGLLIEEHWMQPRAGMMLGMSRTVRDDRVIEYEALRIFVRDADGAVLYDAHPSGQQPTVFTATLVSDTLALFENPQHDFPQRIRYRRGADSLHASIEGMRSGQVRRIEFPFARTACP